MKKNHENLSKKTSKSSKKQVYPPTFYDIKKRSLGDIFWTYFYKIL